MIYIKNSLTFIYYDNLKYNKSYNDIILRTQLFLFLITLKQT